MFAGLAYRYSVQDRTCRDFEVLEAKLDLGSVHGHVKEVDDVGLLSKGCDPVATQPLRVDDAIGPRPFELRAPPLRCRARAMISSRSLSARALNVTKSESASFSSVATSA